MKRKELTSISFYRQPGGLVWTNESEIQNYVEILVLDILIAAGLDADMTINKETSITKFRPDFWLILYQGIPIGMYVIYKY